jgi:hypothetical protein
MVAPRLLGSPGTTRQHPARPGTMFSRTAAVTCTNPHHATPSDMVRYIILICGFGFKALAAHPS